MQWWWLDESHKNNEKTKSWDILLSWIGRLPMRTNCSHGLAFNDTTATAFKFKIIKHHAALNTFRKWFDKLATWYSTEEKRSINGLDFIVWTILPWIWFKNQRTNRDFELIAWDYPYLFSESRTSFGLKYIFFPEIL